MLIALSRSVSLAGCNQRRATIHMIGMRYGDAVMTFVAATQPRCNSQLLKCLYECRSSASFIIRYVVRCL